MLLVIRLNKESESSAVKRWSRMVPQHQVYVYGH